MEERQNEGGLIEERRVLNTVFRFAFALGSLIRRISRCLKQGCRTLRYQVLYTNRIIC